MAQTTGYITDNRTGEKILVLVRGRFGKTATYRSLKRRQSGQDGNHFEDEEIFLNDATDILDALKAGEVVKC